MAKSDDRDQHRSEGVSVVFPGDRVILSDVQGWIQHCAQIATIARENKSKGYWNWNGLENCKEAYQIITVNDRYEAIFTYNGCKYQIPLKFCSVFPLDSTS